MTTHKMPMSWSLMSFIGVFGVWVLDARSCMHLLAGKEETEQTIASTVSVFRGWGRESATPAWKLLGMALLIFRRS